MLKKKKSLLVLLIYIATFSFCAKAESEYHIPFLGQARAYSCKAAKEQRNFVITAITCKKKKKTHQNLCFKGRSGKRISWKEQPIMGQSSWNGKSLTA